MEVCNMKTIRKISFQRKWVLVTNLKFSDHYIFATDGGNLWYFKFRLFNASEFLVLNIKGLRHRVKKDIGIERS